MTPRSAAAPALAALLAATPMGAPALTFDIVNDLQISEFESGPGDIVRE